MSIDFGIVESSILPLLKGLKVTAQVCVLGIPLGIVLGTIAAYFSRFLVVRAADKRAGLCGGRA
jgi:polar amino acid transport system permease protein